MSLFLSPSPPAAFYPPRVYLLPPAVSLLLFLPFLSALSHSSSFRIAWRGGPAARLTVLGASYTFTPVCAFFRERTCPFHVPLERARYIYPPFIEYVYTNGQQTDVVDPIVSGASRYLEGSRVELRARSPTTVAVFEIVRSFTSTYDRQFGQDSDMAQLISVKLSRFDGSPWGFRLQGGKDFGTPLVVQKVSQSGSSIDSLFYVRTLRQLRYLFPSILSTMI